MILGLRRHESPYMRFQCDPRGFDVNAKYEVEVRHGYKVHYRDRVTATWFKELDLNVVDRPGSVLIEYKKAY